jgi:DNA-binding CsgD family transcriptional regulator
VTVLAKLTEQQRACLRYVYAHLTSKEIAPLMGIEPGSVDQHIKAAMKTLGVGDRRTASRILAEHEAREDVAPLVYQPLHPPSPTDSYNYVPPIVSGWQPNESPGGSMREEQAFFRVATPSGSPTFQLPLGSSKPGDLNWAMRLAWIVAIAIGVALAFGALVSGIEALSRLTHG